MPFMLLFVCLLRVFESFVVKRKRIGPSCVRRIHLCYIEVYRKDECCQLGLPRLNCGAILFAAEKVLGYFVQRLAQSRVFYRRRMIGHRSNLEIHRGVEVVEGYGIHYSS